MRRSKDVGLLEVFDEEKKEIDSKGHDVHAPQVVQSVNSHFRMLRIMGKGKKLLSKKS